MIATDEPATAPFTRESQDTAPAALPTWFEAPTSWGALRLCTLDPKGRTRHAADAAIRLQAFAPLLDALDDWSGHDAAWRWIEPNACPLTPHTHVWIAWEPAEDDAADGDAAAAIDGQAAARLELPWALLRRLPPPPDALARRLRWPALPSVAVVSRLHLEAEEIEALERGGAVVLPESMQAQWQGVLRAAAEPSGADVGVALALASPGSPRLARDAAPPVAPAAPPRDADRSIACEVRLATASALSAGLLAGWGSGEAGELGELSARASLWRCAGTPEASRCLASGRLMPWGAGWALALEAVQEASKDSLSTKL